jgi:uncharacterized protein (DUF1330 family)
MTVYAIAQISIHDEARYQRYVAEFMPVLASYHGRLLAADTGPEVIEGEWGYEKVILMSFDDRDAFRRWATSEEYRRISTDRLTATDGVVLLVRGLGAGPRPESPQ